MFSLKSCRKALQQIAGAALIGMLCLNLVPVAAAQQPVRRTIRAKRKRQPLPPVDITKLVWPQPPQQPRIRFVAQAIGERDLQGVQKKKASWLEKAAGIQVTDAELPKLKKPYGVAADSKGLIYVADSGQHRIFAFDLEKKTLTYRGDRPPAQLQLPLGVAVDDKDRLFVSDAVLHRITCFGADGGFAAVFGEADLIRPAGLAVDSDLRRLYVADVKGARLAVFDIDTFKLVRFINAQKPNKEEPHGFLGTPTNVAVDADGLIYVVDTIINRVETFDSDGNYIGGFGEQGTSPGTFARPKGIAVDSDGHIYVADDEFNNFQVFTPQGQLLLVVGSFGPQPGQFQLLTGMASDSRNRIIATDTGPVPRVEVFRYITDAEAEEAEKAASQGSGGKTDAKKGTQ